MPNSSAGTSLSKQKFQNWHRSPCSSPSFGQNTCLNSLSGTQKGEDVSKNSVRQVTNLVDALIILFFIFILTFKEREHVCFTKCSILWCGIYSSEFSNFPLCLSTFSIYMLYYYFFKAATLTYIQIRLIILNS